MTDMDIPALFLPWFSIVEALSSLSGAIMNLPSRPRQLPTDPGVGHGHRDPANGLVVGHGEFEETLTVGVEDERGHVAAFRLVPLKFDLRVAACTEDTF